MSNRIKLYKRAYDDAVSAAKKPHPEARSDGDGHCVVCGLGWPESEDDEPHLCPPGFFWKSPVNL